MITAQSATANPYLGTLAAISQGLAQITLAVVGAGPLLVVGAGACPAGCQPDWLMAQPGTPAAPFDTSAGDMNTPVTDPGQIIAANILAVLNTLAGSASNGQGLKLSDMIAYNYKSVIGNQVLTALSPLNVPGIDVDVSRAGIGRVNIVVSFDLGSGRQSVSKTVNA